jgi:hypothetical protein
MNGTWTRAAAREHFSGSRCDLAPLHLPQITASLTPHTTYLIFSLSLRDDVPRTAVERLSKGPALPGAKDGSASRTSIWTNVQPALTRSRFYILDVDAPHL